MRPAWVRNFLRDPRHRLSRWAVVVLLGLLVADVVPGWVDKEHAHTALERLPGFWTVFGLIGCILIVLLSKWYGHAGILTREDYYDDE
jgi:hypothetical protein